MANTKGKLTVTTEVGTFTRTTARTYTHLVVGVDYRAEWLEARRVAELARARKDFARYSDPDAHREIRAHARVFDTQCHEQFKADGSYARWAENERATIDKLEAQGTIAADEARTDVLGWCGRLDLARKLAATNVAQGAYRTIRIYDVTTGERVQ
jgi:hypothetical protein